MREKQVDFDGLATIIGITPACAGKTEESKSEAKESRDHPRVCGKNMADGTVTIKALGSPPRVREKHRTTIRTP